MGERGSLEDTGVSGRSVRRAAHGSATKDRESFIVGNRARYLVPGKMGTTARRRRGADPCTRGRALRFGSHPARYTLEPAAAFARRHRGLHDDGTRPGVGAYRAGKTQRTGTLFHHVGRFPRGHAHGSFHVHSADLWMACTLFPRLGTDRKSVV